MKEEKTIMEVSAKEKADFEAWRVRQERSRRRKENREAYASIVDEQLALAVPELVSLSEQIRVVKQTVFENFSEVLRMKAEVMGLTQTGQHSHTFTNSDSTMRLTLGSNTIDGWRDTVEEGVEMVRNYIKSLADTPETQALVDMVLRLLSRDQAGNLQASRVLQLRKMAEKTENEQFIEGVRIIEEAYQPTETKQYIRAEVRDGKNAWRTIPLSLTDC